MNRFIALSLLLLAAACHPTYGHVDLTLYSSPPVPVRVESDEVELPVGVAVAIDVEPKSGNDYEYFKDDEVTLDTEDRQILRVDPTENPRRFVLTGVKAGQTCVVVEVFGEREECIPATVLAAQ